MPETHEERQLAESFGATAAQYDRARPRYPDELITRIAAPAVLDVGCGTGIVARQLTAAGSTVLGVDADPRMAAFARTHGVDCEVARFEQWDPRGRTFDGVVAGQTWHWIDPAAGAARAASVLNPGGRLTVFWNAFLTPPAVGTAFADAYAQAIPQIPREAWTTPGDRPYGPMIDKAAAALPGTFGEPERWRFEWETTYTRDAWLDVVPTQAFSSRLTPAQLSTLLTALGDAIDTIGGTLTVPYATVALSATVKS
jgi:SAM-dependent methyltransferase